MTQYWPSFFNAKARLDEGHTTLGFESTDSQLRHTRSQLVILLLRVLEPII